MTTLRLGLTTFLALTTLACDSDDAAGDGGTGLGHDSGQGGATSTSGGEGAEGDASDDAADEGSGEDDGASGGSSTGGDSTSTSTSGSDSGDSGSTGSTGSTSTSGTTSTTSSGSSDSGSSDSGTTDTGGAGGTCVGSVVCVGQPAGVCQLLGCTDEGECVGTEPSCETHSDQFSCLGNFEGCQWMADCQGTPNADHCDSLPQQQLCEAIMGCSWEAM